MAGAYVLAYFPYVSEEEKTPCKLFQSCLIFVSKTGTLEVPIFSVGSWSPSQILDHKGLPGINTLARGARKLTGVNLKVVWGEFSTLSQEVVVM
jgi:hypothetical protein